MKRLFATLLTLILVLNFGFCAFATEPQEETETSPLRTLYETETKLVGAPTVIENISTSDNLINLDNPDAPQGAWLDIGKSSDLDAVKIKDDKVALSYFLTCLENTIPILKVDNKKTAESVYYYLLEELATDYIIASENISALKFFAEQKTDNVILAYIAKPNAKPEKIVAEANSVGANICVLEKADRETTEYLQSRFLSVTVFDDDLNTRDSLDAATDCGANGVVVNSASDTYRLYEKVKKTTYLRKPFIVADAPLLSTKETTNTLEALTKAYKSGADSVSVSVKFDKEDNVICLADSKAEAQSSSLEDICKLLSKQDTQKTLILKIQKNDDDLLKKIKATIKKQDVLDRILIDSANEEVINSCREIMAEVGFCKTLEENEALSPLLLRGIIKAVETETPDESETVEDEVSSALETAAKTGAMFIKTDFADLGKDLKDSIKFKSALDIFGDIEVTKITINKISLELRTGKTKTIKATISPENATDKTVTWKTSDPKVATVDKNGLITAKRAGKAVITATADGGLYVTCVVTVKGYLVLILLVLLFLSVIVLAFYLFKIKKINLKNIKFKMPKLKKETKDDTKKPKHF